MTTNNLINNQKFKVYNAAEITEGDSFFPMDIITPYILTLGETLVLCGSKESGKTDFLLHWMMHVAAGSPFLNMSSPRPMKVLCIQTEASYKHFKRCVQAINPDILSLAKENIAFFISPKIQLDEQGIETIIKTSSQYFKEGEVDIIAIDNTINEGSNVDKAEGKPVSSPAEYYLETLREKLNPCAGIVLTYSYNKKNKIAPVERPFCYYNTIIMHNRSLNHFAATLEFDFPNHRKLPSIEIDKSHNHWYEVTKRGDHVESK